MLELLKEIFFPPSCAYCRRIGTFLCASCYDQLCFRTAPVTLTTGEQKLVVHSAVSYTTVARSLIHEYKFYPVPELASVLAEIMFQSLTLPELDVITFVPLHPQRLQERGFHQTKLLAEQLAKLLDLPCYSLLERTQHTQAQAEVQDRQQRLERMNGLFRISEAGAKLVTPETRILIIDDVCTTGATLQACATELHKSSFNHIFACTIAHG